MRRVLIACFSSSGETETTAGFMLRHEASGHEAVTRRMHDVRARVDLTEYDRYTFGSPTFSLDLRKPARAFLSLSQGPQPKGKMGSAFRSYGHDVSYQRDACAPALIFKALQTENQMKPFRLGPFNLKEDAVETREDVKACQDNGRVFGERSG